MATSGQIIISPSKGVSPGALEAGSAGSFAGNESTSVGRSLPRNSRFSLRTSLAPAKDTPSSVAVSP